MLFKRLERRPKIIDGDIVLKQILIVSKHVMNSILSLKSQKENNSRSNCFYSTKHRPQQLNMGELML